MSNAFAEPTFQDIARFLALAFFAVLFLQSSLDKLIHRKDNLDYLTSVFANSPLKNWVSLLFPLITLLEFSAGTICAIGLVLLFMGILHPAKLGLLLSGLSLLSLFAGQRIAKDYAGAASLAAYFAVVLLAFSLFV